MRQLFADFLIAVANLFYALGDEEHCDDDISKPRNSRLVRIGDWIEDYSDQFNLRLQNELYDTLIARGM